MGVSPINDDPGHLTPTPNAGLRCAPGSDYPEATNHRIEAIASWLPWVSLTRRIGPRDRWYESQPTCVQKPAGTDCDEYPYNRTFEGG